MERTLSQSTSSNPSPAICSPYLALFYRIPRDYLSKHQRELSMPRQPFALLHSDDWLYDVQSPGFEAIIRNIYTRSIWNHMPVPGAKGKYTKINGLIEHYDKNSPLRLFANQIFDQICGMNEQTEFSSRALSAAAPDYKVPWFSEKQFNQQIGEWTLQIIAQQNWQPIIDLCWQERDLDDFSSIPSNGKTDAYRKWTHSRAENVKVVSFDAMKARVEQTGGKHDVSDQDVDTRDEIDLEEEEDEKTFKQMCNVEFITRCAEEIYESDEVRITSRIREKVTKNMRDRAICALVYQTPIWNTLYCQDKHLLALKLYNLTNEEIAKFLGFSSQATVSKHLKKIFAAFDVFYRSIRRLQHLEENGEQAQLDEETSALMKEYGMSEYLEDDPFEYDYDAAYFDKLEVFLNSDEARHKYHIYSFSEEFIERGYMEVAGELFSFISAVGGSDNLNLDPNREH